MSAPAYDAYRDSGIDWLGRVPGHWSICKLKHVLSEMGSGGTPETDKESFWSDDETGTPWVAIGDMSDRQVVTATAKRLTHDGVTSKRLDVWPRGTLLFSMYASLGHTAVAGIPLTVNQAILALVPKPGVNQSYVKRWFEFLRPHLRAEASSNTQDNLNASKVANLVVALPPPAEQAAIAAFLDRETGKIDALVEAQTRLIELLNEKRQAVISHAVTKSLDPAAPMKDSGVEWLGQVPAHWEVAPLKRYVTLLSGYAFPSSGFSNSVADIRLLRGANIAVGRIRWDDVVYWPSQEGLEQFSMRSGDIVLGMDRPWIADGLRIAQLSNDDTPCLLLQRVAALRANDALRPDHLIKLLMSEAFYHHCAPEMTGVSVPHISPAQVGDFVIAMPPPAEQREIELAVRTKTDQITALVAEAEAAIVLLQERRAALISAAVTGKIDVRGIVPEQAEAA